MREILERRLKHKEWEYPDLILIDGGEPQLRAVREILEPTGIRFIGIAKEFDRVIVPEDEDKTISSAEEVGNSNNPEAKSEMKVHEIAVAPNSHVVKLLERIRDESHRFAITYHRLLQRKRMVE